MRLIIAFLAALLIASPAHARPIVWGGTPCTNAATDNDGCYNGGAVQVPTFFRGYATQGSAGVSYPSSTSTNPWYSAINPTTSVQPVIYPTRPSWNVAGVDYAVGMPRWQMPTLGNLHPSYLKDPAQIATDPLINPKQQGENCQFYASNTAVSGGVTAGTTATPFPFPLGGAGIYCSNSTGSTNQLIFDGYNFAWNSSTGWGCLPIYFANKGWGTSAANTSPNTANVIMRNSLFVEGPNCNIWGGINQGSGTAQAGPENAGAVYAVAFANGSTTLNSLAFMNNTIYGCGGDALATALETALCSASFNSTTYAAGSITGWVTGATVGVAPFNGHLLGISGGTAWIEFNAFMHLPGRMFDMGNVNIGNHTIVVANNYIEGMLYKQEPGVLFSSIVCSANCSTASPSTPAQEVVTTVAPHGIPVGSYYSLVLSGNGAAGDYWGGTFTFQATDATHLTFQSVANAADWTYSGSGNYGWVYSNFGHGELWNTAATTNGATFTGTISGNTLTVSGLSGTLTAGQYVTANGAADGVINGTISGTTLTVNSVTSGTLAAGQIIAAASGSGLSIPAAVTIVSGSGSTWTLSQALGTIGPGTINTYDAIPAPTYITGGSGSTWTLNQSLGNIGPTPMTAPYYTPGIAGGTTTYVVSYNTYLQTPSAWGYGGTAILWPQTNSNLMGVPLATLTGSIDHNVLISDLQNNARHLQNSYGVSFQATKLAGFTLNNNYFDPTGQYYCWIGYTLDSGSGPTLSGNVNLLNPSDPYANTMDSYAIIPYVSGAGTNTQGENGLVYNPANGVLTITLASNATFSAGQQFFIRNGTVNTGTNYLAGTLTAASVSGATVTVNLAPGYTGVPTSFTGDITLINSSGQAQACYGHN
ncbi:hypothetical protein [Novosphingobium sp. FSW06-99]|uniref:hypothetical protein n=1 Tax=Novosphingobium sp. FSW06-99 TaxID=1739113 RepID=UPI00076CF200|nr:hypothetical protein [Novosphingobium sp. FSW06-99]KUR80740.1 hypothetical protein AQZ49_01550 [Novosphingobium sp. FSW06-99]